jgi:hypothetical protein
MPKKTPVPDSVRAYMSAIASKRTPAKTKAAQKNIAKATAARRRNVLDLPCICGAGDDLTPGAHPTTCPRGRLLYQRARSAAARAAKDAETLSTNATK